MLLRCCIWLTFTPAAYSRGLTAASYSTLASTCQSSSSAPLFWQHRVLAAWIADCGPTLAAVACDLSAGTNSTCSWLTVVSGQSCDWYVLLHLHLWTPTPKNCRRVESSHHLPCCSTACLRVHGVSSTLTCEAVVGQLQGAAAWGLWAVSELAGAAV